MTKTTKILAWLAVVWNVLGVLAFIAHIMMSPEAMSTLPEAQREVYENTPVWSVVVFAIAVFGGVIGSTLFAFAKRTAFPVLVISLCGVIAQQYYNFVVIDSIALLGASAVIMPIFVTLISILLVVSSYKGSKIGWLK